MAPATMAAPMRMTRPAATTPGTAAKPLNLDARMSPADAAQRLEHIRSADLDTLQGLVRDCRACKLCESGRKQTVFGAGDLQARWLVVGEAPGADEDEQGLPFVGRSGKLLDAMLASIGLARGHGVFIANVIKCRPPANRNPDPDEIAACEPFLKRQLELIKPDIILTMGRFAVSSLLQSKDSIGSLRLKAHRYQGVPVVVTYHPAYLLRNLVEKAKAWRDLCFARSLMAQSATQAAPPTPAPNSLPASPQA